MVSLEKGMSDAENRAVHGPSSIEASIPAAMVLSGRRAGKTFGRGEGKIHPSEIHPSGWEGRGGRRLIWL